MINAAIVGLGRWGRNIVNAVQGKSERVRFSRAVARHPEKARDFADQHRLRLSTDLAEALVDPRVQAVVLTTPHSMHTEQVLAAAAAGKPVFCEKPLALSVADASRAIEACRRAGVPLGLGHDKRFYPSMQELERIVASGRLGDVLHIEGHFSNETTRKYHAGWRALASESPGGGLTANGIHIFDAFVNLVGPAHRIDAKLLEHPPEPDPVDTLSVFVEFERGVSGVLCGVRSTPWYWRVHVFGKQGSAEALSDTELVLRMGDAKPERIVFEPIDTLRFELDAFADAIEGRTPFPIPTEQMLANVGMLEATLDSLAAGGPVLVKRA